MFCHDTLVCTFSPCWNNPLSVSTVLSIGPTFSHAVCIKSPTLVVAMFHDKLCTQGLPTPGESDPWPDPNPSLQALLTSGLQTMTLRKPCRHVPHEEEEGKKAKKKEREKDNNNNNKRKKREKRTPITHFNAVNIEALGFSYAGKEWTVYVAKKTKWGSGGGWHF